jgi:hypothetical protein
MARLFGREPSAPSPEDVPQNKLSPLSRKYLDWKTGMVVVIGVLLVFTFLNVFITNPTVSGYAFFGLFLFMLTRKLGDRK